MRLIRHIPSLIVALILFAIAAFAQGNYRAQLRGVVSDATGAVLPKATVTIRDEGTNVSSSARTDDKGTYFFTGLRPSSYAVKVEATGFRVAERTGVVLAVDQESSLNFKLELQGVLATMDVTATQPLLDTDNATLGTDITSEYVKELPLVNRNFFGMAFLSAGVTEVAGSGTNDNYPSGTNFASNGQRNATAEVRLDGVLVRDRAADERPVFHSIGPSGRAAPSVGSSGPWGPCRSAAGGRSSSSGPPSSPSSARSSPAAARARRAP